MNNHEVIAYREFTDRNNMFSVTAMILVVIKKILKIHGFVPEFQSSVELQYPDKNHLDTNIALNSVFQNILFEPVILRV